MLSRAVVLIALVLLVSTGIVRSAEISLPSRKGAVVLPLLRQFHKEDTYSKIEKILGKPDADVGSGIYIFVFKLDDSSSVEVGSTDHNSVVYIRRSRPGIEDTQVIFARDKTWGL